MSTEPASVERSLLAHRSTQTGDTIHVAGALALYHTIDVIVIHIGDIGTTEALLNFYRQATDPTYPATAISPFSAALNTRVKVVYAENEKVADELYTTMSWVKTSNDSIEKELPRILGYGTLKSEISNIDAAPLALKPIKNFADFKMSYLNENYLYGGNLGGTTSDIAKKFKGPPSPENYKALYTTLARKLSARGLTSADIIHDTLQGPKFGPNELPNAITNKAPIVLLWARYTGTNTATGHNPDGDSCFQGQKQIDERLSSLGYNVVTIGHGPRGCDPYKAQFPVGEFYKQAPITSDRATQQSFFLALMERYPGRVYQVGQKTGAMDGAALLGVPTIYLEPKGSAAIKRMGKWSDGSLPFYRGVIIEQPAPALVRVLRKSVPDTHALYNEWTVSKNPVLRGRARLAAMTYVYPIKMGLKDFEKKELPEMPKQVTTEAQVKGWTAKATREERDNRFRDIVKWAEKADVGEDHNDPDSDGEWTKKVQVVSQSDLGPGTAGYSKEDLDQIEKVLGDIQQQYCKDDEREGTAVIRVAGAYRTRFEAKQRGEL